MMKLTKWIGVLAGLAAGTVMITGAAAETVPETLSLLYKGDLVPVFFDADRQETLQCAVLPAWAESAEPVPAGSYQINPIGSELLPEDLPEPEGEQGETLFVEQAAVYYTTVEDAADAIMDAMKRREAAISVGVTREVYNILNSTDLHPHNVLFNAACEHDPNDPTAGDYHGQLYHYWQSDSSWYGNNHSIVYNITYRTTLAEEQQVDAAVAELVAQWTAADMKPYEAICTIYDYITENVVYDYDGLDAGDLHVYTAYKGLIEGKAVCMGIANLFYRLAMEMGIDARMIHSIERENHAWNIVELDGLYYNLDATWDLEANPETYNYFLLSPEIFGIGHTRRSDYDTADFHRTYPMDTVGYLPFDGSISGTCGENLTWTLTDKGILSIEGTGAMYDYDFRRNGVNYSPWSPWTAKITGLNIGEGVSYLGNWAFMECVGLDSIAIPGSVERIGSGTFAFCEWYTELTLSEGLENIGGMAFYGSKIDTLNLPSTLQTIGSQAFSYCLRITELTIPENVTNIGDMAFSYNTSLETLRILGNLDYLGVQAFSWCYPLTRVEFHGGVPGTWGPEMFGNNDQDPVIYAARNNTWIPYEADDGSLLWNAPDGTAYKFEWLDGEETPGDLTGDGKTDEDDAAMISAWFAGMYAEIPFDPEMADCNGDGKFTRADGMYLARALAGWEGYTLP